MASTPRQSVRKSSEDTTTVYFSLAASFGIIEKGPFHLVTWNYFFFCVLKCMKEKNQTFFFSPVFFPSSNSKRSSCVFLQQPLCFAPKSNKLLLLLPNRFFFFCFWEGKEEEKGLVGGGVYQKVFFIILFFFLRACSKRNGREPEKCVVRGFVVPCMAALGVIIIRPQG